MGEGEDGAGEGAQVVLSAPGDERTFKNPVGGQLTFRARSEQTGGALTALESVAAQGEGPPLHRHPREDECVYVLEGDFRFVLEGEIHMAPTGTFVFIPRGTSHTWQNASGGPARLLAVFTPAAPGMERFFERAAELGDRERPAEAFAKLAGDAGMDVLGPPLGAREPAA
jgi:quercetin dioxygenase-like cupin family protein